MTPIFTFFSSKSGRFLAALLSGLLLGLSWYFPALVFVGFIPLLLAEHILYKNKIRRSLLKLFLYSFLAFVVWNMVVYWWLWRAAAQTTLAAWGANAFLMTFPILAYHQAKKWGSNAFGYLAFVCAWMGFEYLHLHWNFSWVWLNLGNVFAQTPNWVQWFSYTGSFGGTLWVLLVNVGLLLALLQKKRGSMLLFAALTCLLPLLVSYLMLWQYEPPQGKAVEILSVQPNLDCYTEKFRYNAKKGTQNKHTYVPYEQQIDRLISLTAKEIGPQTRFVLWPEAAIHHSVEEGAALQDENVRKVHHFMSKNPQAALVSGLNTYKVYGKVAKTPSARYQENIGFYDYFNTAVLIYGNRPLEFYNKSKLVIGAETIPYPAVLNFLMLNLGGVSGGMGRQNEAEVFFKDDIGLAPLICYESVYGEYVSEFVKKGAQILSVITNDGWWGDTPGYKQHLNYARLRAIENRRYIARSANTGVSGFISPTGKDIKLSKYDEMTTVKATISTNKKMTFYSKHGDYLGRLAAFLIVFMFIAAFVRRKIRAAYG